ncbi:molybdenum cofactor biosynthesis protein MoaE [Corynebacterium poyangense]|nr:molybdenum cofactor biosynthesis protein MoaE [Corynebacterium poyangense]
MTQGAKNMRTGLVIVASTRAARGTYEDRSGPIAVEFLNELGYHTPPARVVEDSQISNVIDELFRNPRALPDVLLTSGGTGVTLDDLTVEVVSRHIQRPMPGIVQAFFLRGLENTPLAVASRAVAGISGRTFCMTLPGSTGGVRDGCEVLRPLLPHLTQLLNRGQDTTDTKAGTLVTSQISAQPLEQLIAQAKTQTTTPEAGAVVCFEGVVRNHDGGHAVKALSYSAHPSADRELARVVSEVLHHYPPVRAWVAHRTGDLRIGDLAFLVVVAAPHRTEAFAALAEICDRVKTEVPIWKEQLFVDGSTEWVGLQ